jgi:uncharacterized FlaG/YvyC family protein
VAPKIERVWGTIFGQTAVNRKESPDHDSQAPKDQKKNQRDNEEKRDEQRPADSRAVEQAMNDLRSTPHFTQTGLSVEMLQSVGGLRVRLVQPGGAVVKEMTAEEFLKLREASVESQPRGKILDQKF